jgi:glycosyltransferase 2 family protein
VKKYWRLLGSLALVGVLAWRLDWRQVAAAFAHLDVTLWLLALGLYLLTQGVSALRWQMLARMLGLGGRWRDYLAYYFIGMFFNLVLPTSVGGDVVRAWYLGRQAGPPPAPEPVGLPTGRQALGRRTASFLSVLADRVNGLAVLIAVACLAALCCPVPLPAWMTWTVACTGGAAALGLASLPALPWLEKVLPAHRRLTPLLAGARLCLRDRRGVCLVTALSLVVQLANVVLAWLVGEGLGLPVPPLYYGVLVPLVSLLTLLPVSLNGMGLREAGTVLLLAPVGVGAAPAVTLSLLIFAVYAAASLGGGVFYLLGRSPRFEAALAAGEADGPAHPGEEGRPHDEPVGGDPGQGRARQPPAAA